MLNKLFKGKKLLINSGQVAGALGNENLYYKNRNMTQKQFRKADFDGDGVPNHKDCRPFDKHRDMVHYGYYEAIDDTGVPHIEYAGSIRAVKKMGESNRLNYVDIREMPYSEAKQKLDLQQMGSLRAKSKSIYSNRGTVKIPSILGGK